MMGVPFCALTQNGQSVAINDLLRGDFAAGDTIQYWSGTQYEGLTYRASSTLNGVAMGPAWCEGRSTYSTKTLAPGDAFWIDTEAEVILVGQVADESTVSFGEQRLKMIANPRPTDVAINDITFTGLTAGDTIQIYTSTGYVGLTYRASSTLNGVAMGPAWCEGRSTYSTKTIPAGTGFWIDAKESATATFN